MATDAQIRQKNLENQLKLDAKLHDLEVRPYRNLYTCQPVCLTIFHVISGVYKQALRQDIIQLLFTAKF